ERAFPGELCLVTERNLDLIGSAFFDPRTVSGKDQEFGLAHIEIQIDRIERDERREQCGRAGRGTAAGNQVADRDEMSADASGEGCRDTPVFEIGLSTADLTLRIVQGRLRGSVVRC